MRTVRMFLSRLLGFVRARQLDLELHEEITSHLEEATDEYLRQGLSPTEARLAARHSLGGTAQAEEACRDARSFVWLDHLRRDAHHAARALRRSPGFTLIAVLTLALGIGANTAIFSVVDAVLLHPLPYANRDQLVSLWESHLTRGRGTVSVANLVDYRRAIRSFVDIESYSLLSRSLTSLGTPEQILGEAVSTNMFAVRGVQPALGRTFLPEENQPGRNRVVIVTDPFWRGHLGADPGVLGRPLMLDGREYTIVGVMPPDVCGCSSDFRSSISVAFLTPALYSASLLADHGSHDVSAVGRLKPGVTLAQAQADLDVIMKDLAIRYPDQAAEYRAVIAPLHEDVVRDVHRSLVMLLGAVGLVLLIACVNVANLMLVRALSQRRELAIRRALGASHARIIAEMTTRALLLALVGGGIGLLCGVWMRDVLVSFAPATIPRLHALTIDVRVLLATFSLSVLTGVVSGIFPAWALLREDPAPTLKTSPSAGSVSRSVLRWRAGLMAAEVAAAVMLAIGAGLLVRSLTTLARVDLGFQTERVLTFQVPLPVSRYVDAGARLAFFEALSERIQREPGVMLTAFANRFPLSSGWGGGLSLRTPSGVVNAQENGLQAVSPTYFTALGIKIVRGRPLSNEDRSGSMPVAVVNRAFAQKYAAADDPIGWQFTRGNPSIPLVTIVGVVEDIRRDGRAASIEPQVYLPAAQIESYERGGPRLSDVAVKASGDIVVLVPAIRRHVSAIDMEQPITNVKTLEEVLSTSLAERRFNLGLMTSFAMLAVGLALIGVYGVVAYAVNQRSREIGVRIALGATRRDVLRLFVGDGLKWTVTGVTLGLAGAFATTRVMAPLLFGVTPADPLTFAATPVVVFVVAGVACYFPARKAADLDPVVALRGE